MLCCAAQLVWRSWPANALEDKLVAVMIGCWDIPCWEAAAQQAALQQSSLIVSASPEAQLLVRAHA